MFGGSPTAKIESTHRFVVCLHRACISQLAQRFSSALAVLFEILLFVLLSLHLSLKGLQVQHTADRVFDDLLERLVKTRTLDRCTSRTLPPPRRS